MISWDPSVARELGVIIWRLILGRQPSSNSQGVSQKGAKKTLLRVANAGTKMHPRWVSNTRLFGHVRLIEINTSGG